MFLRRFTPSNIISATYMPMYLLNIFTYYTYNVIYVNSSETTEMVIDKSEAIERDRRERVPLPLVSDFSGRIQINCYKHIVSR